MQYPTYVLISAAAHADGEQHGDEGGHAWVLHNHLGNHTIFVLGGCVAH